MLEVEDGVRVLDRRREQALRVLRRRRADDLEARDVRERALRVLRVERAAREAAAATAGARRSARGVPPRKYCLAATVTRWSQAHETKSANCISATGRSPMSAAPVRAADDRRLRERRVEHAPRPELLLEAVRDLEGAAVHPDVLAEHEDPRIAAHLLAEPVRDRLDVRPLGHYLWWGVSRSSCEANTLRSRSPGSGSGDCLGALERLVQESLDRRGDVVLLLVRHVGVPAKPVAVALDRVLLRPLLEHVLRDVERVVVHRMPLHAEREALDQGRSAAGASLLDRALRLAVHGEDVGAVDDDALEAVGGGAIGDVLDRVAEVRRRRIRPLVVVADVHDRQAPDAREVHALVRVASRGRAFAEPADGDALVAADPECERHSRRDRAASPAGG